MNMLGRREPDIYGKEDYAALCARIYEHAQNRGLAVESVSYTHLDVYKRQLHSKARSFLFSHFLRHTEGISSTSSGMISSRPSSMMALDVYKRQGKTVHRAKRQEDKAAPQPVL